LRRDLLLPLAAAEAINAPARAVASAEQRHRDPPLHRTDQLARHPSACQVLSTALHPPPSRIQAAASPDESTVGYFPHHHCRLQELLELEISATEPPYSDYK
jgi:hypothetical protein